MATAPAADSERFAARYRVAGLDVMKVTHFDELAELLGDEDARERIVSGRRTAAAIADGLLVRTQYVAAH